jgi:tRNA pseudouridine55 synthase
MFYYDNEKALDPFKHLALSPNVYIGEEEDLQLGKKLSKEHFENSDNGVYLVETSNFFSIIELSQDGAKYRFNRIPKFEN